MNFPIFPAGSDMQELDKSHEYYYIVSKDGFFLRKQTALYKALVQVDEIGYLPKQEETLSVRFKPLPWKMLQTIVAFLHAVYAKYNGEGIVILHYSAVRQEWGWVVPPQETDKNGLHVDYKPEDVKLPEGAVLAGTVHSHCSASAFQSGTDSHDENHFDGLHITVGNLDTIPSFHVRFIAHGNTWNFEDISTLVEGFGGEFPSEMMDMVKEKQSAISSGGYDDSYGSLGGSFPEQTKLGLGLSQDSDENKGTSPWQDGHIWDMKRNCWTEPYNCRDDRYEVGSTVVFLNRKWVKRAKGKWVLADDGNPKLSKAEWKALVASARTRRREFAKETEK
jgi:PRTRC genetic system protein A